MPRIKLKRRINIAGCALEGFETCSHYAIVNWCKNKNGEKFTNKQLISIFVHHWQNRGPEHPTFAIHLDLADPKIKCTQHIAEAAMKNKPFFRARGEAIIMKYEQQVLGEGSWRSPKIQELL